MAWNQSKDLVLRERAEAVLPGGVYGHESTKYLPNEFPQFFDRADGAWLWDNDGNRYIDWLCAYGPNLLGYRNPAVEAAALEQLARGDTLTGPGAVMVEFAEAFVQQVSHADWVFFCKNGTDATTIARTIARAHTRKRKIILAENTYHGAMPWCTPVKVGILPEDRAHIIYCTYNDVGSLEEAIREAGDDLAGIFATPFRHEILVDQFLPDPGFAMLARNACDKADALLVIDDVRAGFRLARDCSWANIVQPDLSTWGKVIANGHAISAVAGSDRAREAASAIFATGSFWFSAVPMAAGVATLKLIRETDYLEHTIAIGDRLRTGLAERAQAYGFSIRQTGPSQMPQVLFDDDPDLRLGYRWTAEVMKRGAYLHPFHNMFVSSAHSEADVAATLDVAEESFRLLKSDRDMLGANTKLADFFAYVGGH